MRPQPSSSVRLGALRDSVVANRAVLLAAAALLTTTLLSCQSSPPQTTTMDSSPSSRTWAGCCGQRMTLTGDPHHYLAQNQSTIDNTPIPEGYADEIYGLALVIKATLPPAKYTVEIAGSENVFNAPKKRLFNLLINKTPVQSDIDLFALAGNKTGVPITLTHTITHPGGPLTITLLATKNNAKFSAIRVLDPTGNKVAWALAEDQVNIEKVLNDNVPHIAGKVLWTDYHLPTEVRVADLLKRMSLREKVAQMMNAAPAIDRLGVPAYNYWNECLHGVARAGNATVFPQAIGMAASWDAAEMHTVADTISTEARAKHADALKNAQRDIYMGLTFWTPNINMFRDPRWGRGQETYGEDPYLAGKMATAFITGLQGDDPKYFKVVATAKHYAVHSGPELLRHVFNAQPPERDFYEDYLPQFEMAVRDAHVYSIMGAYNSVYGSPACASDLLLQKILRDKWGFKGYVVSDCSAITDIWYNHKFVDVRAQAAAAAVKAGCDLECGSDYSSLASAADMGLISEKEIDTALGRVLSARFRLGMFDPDSQVPYTQIPSNDYDTPQHDAIALDMAHKSMVLLKNDHILPLSKTLKKIAVVGPNADSLLPLLGNYTGTPSRTATSMILDGIRAAVPGTEVIYVRGCDLAYRKNSPELVPDVCLRSGNATGLRGEYFDNEQFAGTPVAVRQDKCIDFNGTVNQGMANVPAKACSVRWTGNFIAPADGTYNLAVDGNTAYRFTLNGQVVRDTWDIHSNIYRDSPLQLKKGDSIPLLIECHQDTGVMNLSFVWDQPQSDFSAQVVDQIKGADAIIFVGGLDGRTEQEEGNPRAPFDGFLGGDRTRIELPTPQTQLLKSLVATNTPVVFVNLTGSAVAIPWEAEHVPAILQAWYPGQTAGRAVADVLFGDYNPAGRLPVTFYRSTDDLPDFRDYSMANRSYRHFTGTPLWPFGFGLSYTTFSYDKPTLDADPNLTPKDLLNLSATIHNTGDRDGEEVVQLYAHATDSLIPHPIRKLIAFQRIAIPAGKMMRVTLPVRIADLQYWNTAKQEYEVEPGPYALEVASSSADIRQTIQINVK